MNHLHHSTTSQLTERSTRTMDRPATPLQRHHTTLLRGTAALALIASGLVGACSGGDSDKSPSTAADQPKATSTRTGSTTGSAKSSTSDGGVGARSDLQGFTCDAAKSGVWSANGKVVNSTKKSATYTVDVAVASVKTSTVVGRATKTLTVEAGKTVSFSVPQVANRKGDGLACYPHVTRVGG